MTICIIWPSSTWPRERPGHTKQTTALVHEAYLRLLASGQPSWNDKVHFFAVCARTMRRSPSMIMKTDSEPEASRRCEEIERNSGQTVAQTLVSAAPRDSSRRFSIVENSPPPGTSDSEPEA
jgi:hypothetical protein